MSVLKWPKTGNPRGLTAGACPNLSLAPRQAEVLANRTGFIPDVLDPHWDSLRTEVQPEECPGVKGAWMARTFVGANVRAKNGQKWADSGLAISSVGQQFFVGFAGFFCAEYNFWSFLYVLA